jgi:hypothetical protein
MKSGIIHLIKMKNMELNLSKILGLFASVVLIWVFLFSIWYSNNILNQEKFVATTNRVLQSEQARDAISNEVISVIKQRRPIIGTISEPLLTNLISGVLNSDFYSNVTTRLAQELQLQLTSANPRELGLDLRPTKNLLNPILERTDSELLERIPDNIVVLRRNQIPSLYQFGTILTVFGPVALIIALILLALIWVKVTDKRNYITLVSLCFAGTGLLIYFLIPAIGNYAVAQANSVNIATIINEVYVAFTAPITAFASNVIVAGVIIALIAKFLKRELFRLPKTTSSAK